MNTIEVTKEQPARELTTVIRQMVDALPDNETELGGRLMSLHSSALFTAPEVIGMRWREVAIFLSHHLPHRLEDMSNWQRVVINIFNENIMTTQTETSRADHLAWCKQRALEYVDLGDNPQAFASMASDLNKHSGTQGHSAIQLGTMLLFGGHLSTPEQMRKFIEGFN